MPLNDTTVNISVSDSSQISCGSVSNFFEISVNPLPVITLSMSSLNDSSCSGSPIIFAASPIGFDNYSFYRGFLLLQGSASNEYSASDWVNGNTIYAIAANHGCTGDSSNFITPVISQPLPTPQVNCGTSTDTTIEFTWLPITEASGYLVSVNGGPYVSPSSGNLGTTELLTGQILGNSADITVIALGPAPCGNSAPSAIHTCYAMPCTAITFSISPNQTICSGDSVTLSLSGFSIANPLVAWNGGAALPNNNSYIFSSATDSIIPVTISNSSEPSCVPVTNYFIVHVNPSPTAALSMSTSNDTICLGIPAAFSASPAGYSNYSFYNGTNLLQSSNNPNYPVSSAAGTLSIRVRTSYLGCQSTTDTLHLTTLPSPAVILSSVPSSGSICFGDTVHLTALPNDYSKYVFYNGTVMLQDSSLNTFSTSGMSLGNGNNISVIPTNYFGCVGDSSNILNYNVLSPPSILLACSDIDLAVCIGDTVAFTASPAGMASYQFFVDTTSVQISANGIYITSGLTAGDSVSVIGIDNNGCKSLLSNAISVLIKPRPGLFISADDTTLCIGSSAVLTENQNPIVTGTTYSWSTSSTDPSITVSPNSTADYILYSSLNGCAGKPDTITILVDNAPPIASAGSNQVFCIGDSITLTGSGGQSYVWSPAIGLSDPNIAAPHASPPVTTIYTVLATNLYCSDAASVTIEMDLCLSDLTEPIPSCITPNGDGVNDFFKIPDFGYFKNKSLTIYNRWGNVVFKETPYNNDWGGLSLNSSELPDATYYYVLDLGNGSKPHTGYILIQR